MITLAVISAAASEARYAITHRRGWQLILHPDGTTEARGPQGQILRSHAPPTLRAG